MQCLLVSTFRHTVGLWSLIMILKTLSTFGLDLARSHVVLYNFYSIYFILFVCVYIKKERECNCVSKTKKKGTQKTQKTLSYYLYSQLYYKGLFVWEKKKKVGG